MRWRDARGRARRGRDAQEAPAARRVPAAIDARPCAHPARLPTIDNANAMLLERHPNRVGSGEIATKFGIRTCLEQTHKLFVAQTIWSRSWRVKRLQQRCICCCGCSKGTILTCGERGCTRARSARNSAALAARNGAARGSSRAGGLLPLAPAAALSALSASPHGAARPYAFRVAESPPASLPHAFFDMSVSSTSSPSSSSRFMGAPFEASARRLLFVTWIPNTCYE